MKHSMKPGTSSPNQHAKTKQAIDEKCYLCRQDKRTAGLELVVQHRLYEVLACALHQASRFSLVGSASLSAEQQQEVQM